jgi:hypothetical protein
MTRCFQKDWEKCVYKLKRFIKDPDDLEGVKDILEEHYTELCNMFKLCCCFEIGEEPFDIQINGVMEFNNTLLQIPNVELDTIFIATNFTSKKEKNAAGIEVNLSDKEIQSIKAQLAMQNFKELVDIDQFKDLVESNSDLNDLQTLVAESTKSFDFAYTLDDWAVDFGNYNGFDLNNYAEMM